MKLTLSCSGFGWFWLTLIGSGWLWLALAGSGFGWLFLALPPRGVGRHLLAQRSHSPIFLKDMLSGFDEDARPALQNMTVANRELVQA